MLNSGFHMLDDITHGKDGHMDTGVQDGLIIAEDDILRDGGQYPEYTATMFIVIENYYNGIAKGYLQTFYYEEPFYFFGLDNMLIQLENVMDMAGVPRKCNEYRYLSKNPPARKRAKGTEKRNSPVPLQHVRFNPNNICSAKNIFSIRVYSRRNASIQGTLKNSKGQMNFRSGMDVISGIHGWMEEVVNEGDEF